MGRDHLGGVILGLLTLGGIDFSRKRLLSKNEEETLANDLEAKVDYVSQLSDVDKAKVDYTSQLLDDVLSSILSRMTIKDAVKTNILSTSELPAQVKSLIVTTWNTQVTHFPTEIQIFRNPRMLVRLFESTYNFDIVKVSPVLDAYPVLKYWQSTGKLNSPDSEQDVLSHYLRAFTSSCHDFCKYGRKHSSEAKPWHPLSKRKNKLPADEQSPARTLVGEAKKGTLVKQKLSTPPGSVLGEKKKVTGVEQKPSTSPGSMLGEVKKRTVVMQKTSTTSRSNQSDAKKGILVKQKLSTPPVNMLEEGKKVNEVYQKPSSP
ncbi:hypothetical protein T459_05663 [Capsicum annuum]|uniref:Uncharacterized protein n=1 Tax=Capsicum annuum TaxID=4072 RepID=A0A2G3A8M4_CAPAN|nr:hypothetical protein T459_05663 [Capsicum annuum]